MGAVMIATLLAMTKILLKSGIDAFTRWLMPAFTKESEYKNLGFINRIQVRMYFRYAKKEEFAKAAAYAKAMRPRLQKILISLIMKYKVTSKR